MVPYFAEVVNNFFSITHIYCKLSIKFYTKEMVRELQFLMVLFLDEFSE